MIKRTFLALFIVFHALNVLAEEDFELKSSISGNEVIIDFALASDAKLYWVNPGEAGLPTKIDFENSKNLKSAFVNWPAPEISDEYNLSSYVYKNKVSIPVEIEAEDLAKKVEVHIQLSFAVCRETCKSYKEELFQEIKLDKSYVKQAKDEIGIKNIKLETISEQDILSFEVYSERQIKNPRIFLNLPEEFSFNPRKISIISSDKEANLFIVVVPVLKKDKSVELNSFSFILNDSDVFQNYYNYTNKKTGEISIFLILLYAIIGGLILNAMPCVLPIISLKLLSLAKMGTSDFKLARQELLAQSLGIVVSFIIFAIVTYILKSLGKSVGLGFQFQQPLYIISMILILSIVAINLVSEVSFNIKFPDIINRLLPKKEKKLIDYFVTGVFTTFLAIPCTAPFVTVAVGFALTQELIKMLLVFTFLGMGMALPYILISINPRPVLKILPSPGAWMERFKKLIGILVYATCLWLLYVLYTQLGFRAALSLFLLTLLLKFFLCEKRISKKLKILLLLVVASLSFLLPINLNKQARESNQIIDSLWQVYDSEKVKELVSQGNIVIVDVTASWCPTCAINKLSTLDNLVVIDYMKKHKIYGFRADISDSSPKEIEALMAQYKHYGIPLNIIYSKKNEQGKVLPSILTPSKFIAEIKESS